MSLTGLIIGGFIGTAIMTAFMQMGKQMGMMPPDFDMMKDGMGRKMNEMLGVPANMALIMHFTIGGVILPVLYNYIVLGLPQVLGVLGAIIFFNIFGVIMIFMLPMLGAPADWRMKMAVGIIMGHIVYALIVFYTGTFI